MYTTYNVLNNRTIPNNILSTINYNNSSSSQMNIETSSKTNLKKLYNSVGSTINSYIEDFVNNNKEDEIVEILTQDIYEKLAVKILQNKTLSGKDYYYEKSRILLSNTLELLQKGVQLYNTNSGLNETNRILNARSKILESTDVLEEYLNKLKNVFSIFPEQLLQMNVIPKFKPEYIEYINRHGLPDDGIFDSEKLATIIVEFETN